MKKKVKALVEDVPQTIEPDIPKQNAVFKARVISQAPNPQWVYIAMPGNDGKVAAIIPRRLTGKLIGKMIMFEAISDSTGTSYRYVEGQPH